MLVLISVCLGVLLVLSVVMRAVYFYVPAKELKKRARTGDVIAQAIYKAASYEHVLSLFMWITTSLLAAIFIVILAERLSFTWAVLVTTLLLICSFGGLQFLVGVRTVWHLTRLISPGLAWLLGYIAPPVEWAYRHLSFAQPLHTRIYDKDDILDVLERQSNQADSRLSPTEISIVRSSLLFGDKKVRDIMIPKRVVHMVSVNDPIGPLLMDELHKSGHSRFPVIDPSNDAIVGTLFLRDVVDMKGGGVVGDVMQKSVNYIHDEQNLIAALRASIRTKHHLFMVVNSYEDVIGIVTLEDIVEQIIGVPIMDESDTHEDLRVIARKDADTQHATHKDQEASESAPEVVESE